MRFAFLPVTPSPLPPFPSSVPCHAPHPPLCLSHVPPQVMYTIAIFCSLPLMFFPATVILEHALGLKTGTKHSLLPKMKTNLWRVLFLSALAVFAVAGAARLTNFVSVLSAVSGVPLSVLFPPFMHRRLVATSPWVRRADALLGVAGLCLTVFSFVVSIWSWASMEAEAPPVCPGA